MKFCDFSRIFHYLFLINLLNPLPPELFGGPNLSLDDDGLSLDDDEADAAAAAAAAARRRSVVGEHKGLAHFGPRQVLMFE